MPEFKACLLCLRVAASAKQGRQAGASEDRTEMYGAYIEGGPERATQKSSKPGGREGHTSEVARAQTFWLNVEVLNGTRMSLNKLLAGRYLGAHEDIEHTVSLLSIFDSDLQKHAVGGIHGGVP